MTICVRCGNKPDSIIQQASPCSAMVLLQSNGAAPENACGGNGSCGKCKIMVTGAVSAITETERLHLTASELSSGIRLACETILMGDCMITVSHFNASDPHFAQAEAQPLEAVLPDALAIDIGTTTIEAAWYLSTTGRECRRVSFENPQRCFGADVISRIRYAIDNGSAALTDAIRSALYELAPEPLPAGCVITGNTAMLHIFADLDVSGLGSMPFSPVSLFGTDMGGVYLAPCISAYVGGDITTAILASGMLDSNEPALLLDLGTNGELAYWNGSELCVCATAAGPAFEGGGISAGMAAASGAISHVFCQNDALHFETIDNRMARGICGSGIVDAIAVLLDMGILDAGGYLDKAVPIGKSNIMITPRDIRQIQLAKAAIAAGICTLCPSLSDIRHFYLAGSFGQYLNIKNAVRVGLLPSQMLSRTVKLGNAALSGAGLILTVPGAEKQAEQIANMARVHELSTDPVFQTAYIEQMYFSPIDSRPE